MTSGNGRELGASVDMSDSRVWIETSGRDEAAISSTRERDSERE